MVLTRRATRRFLIATALLASCALITGCGGSSAAGTSARTVSLTRAADLSTAKAGYKLIMSMHDVVAGKTIDISGTGGFNLKPREGSLLMNLSADGQSFPIQIVIAHDTIYEQLPSQITSQLPGGRPWISINLRQLSSAMNLPALGSLMSSNSSMSDPSQYMNYLKSAASVTNLGQETIDGVQTTHYSAQLKLSKLTDAVPPALRQSMAQMVRTLEQRFHASYQPINVWIDQSNLIRKIQMTIDESVGGQSVTSQITEQFTAYGTQPAPSVPPAGQTTNVLSLIANGG
jgi:hypothetical protein